MGKRLIGAAASAALVLGLTSIAAADNVQNDVGGSGDTTVEFGQPATVGFRIAANSGDGQSGCNANDGSAATLSFNMPPGMTATPPSLVFSSCGTTQSTQFTSTEAGNFTITVSVSDAGPGSYNTNPATFTLRVLEPADTTPPVITRTVTGTAGANGWYTSDVTVAWVVTDPESPVVIDAGCGTQIFTVETAGTTSSCSAHSAGGAASDSVELRIDKTGPSASLSPSGIAGSPGWFVSDVTVAATGTDTISGPVACTAPQLLMAETASTQVDGSCTNHAGLTTAAAPFVLRLDKTGPVVDLAVIDGTAGENGWYISPVTVAATGTDHISGPVTCSPATALVATETTGTPVSSTCTNGAGLQSNGALTVKLDTSSPSASLVITAGTLGDGGWYTTPVTVETEGSDDISDPTTCTDPQTFADDTSALTVTGSCTNDAGLVRHADPLDLQIDTSPPTGVGLEVVSGTDGANGWYTSDVVVRTTGSDVTSGVTCTDDQTFDLETAGVLVTGSCTNGAGLTAHATPLLLMIDMSAPNPPEATVDPAPNAAGWNNTSPVTVSFTDEGDNGPSGIDACTDTVEVTEDTGAGGVDVEGTCTDVAGNASPATAVTVRLDTQPPNPPIGSIVPAPNGAGWNNGDVTVHFEPAGDTGASGIDSCTADVPLSGNRSGDVVLGYCTDIAGNTSAAAAVTVNIDVEAPNAPTADVSPAANPAGWHHSDVTVTFNAAGDNGPSGVAACTDPVIVGDETTVDGADVSGNCTDVAGNTGASTSVTVRLDETPATGTAFVGGPADGASYYFGSVPAAPTCTATDALSGFATCAVGGYDSSVGTHTLTARAYDVAGNAAEITRTYTVLAWTVTGFYRPVDMGVTTR